MYENHHVMIILTKKTYQIKLYLMGSIHHIDMNKNCHIKLISEDNFLYLMSIRKES